MRKRLHLPVLLFLPAMLLAQGFFSPDYAVAVFPDAVDVRSSLQESLSASAWTARRLPGRIYSSATLPGRVRFSVRTQNDAFYLLLTNESDTGGDFPLYSAGSYIIKRNLDDGGFVQAKIFLKDDPDSFLRIFPFDDRSRIEIQLYGTMIYRDLVLSRSFEELVFGPFSRIASLSAGRVNWNLIFPSSGTGENPLPSMIRTLREAVAELPDMDDGAMDEEGRFIYIESGERSRAGGFNCSGFAKYVMDGLYLPAAGGLMPVEPLKRKQTASRGNSWSRRFEEERDPYFGLDWTRNLALFLFRGATDRGDPEEFDIRQVDFLDYVEDVGYHVADLEFLLYQLALRNPGDFYLGSVNAEFGSDPPLRQHIHVVVLMPFISPAGELQVAVFERNRETSVASLLERYPDEHIHLVRVAGSSRFALPAVVQ